MALARVGSHPLRGNRADEEQAFVGDAKVLIMASFGVRGDKRLDADDQGQIEQLKQSFPEHLLPYGWL